MKYLVSSAPAFAGVDPSEWAPTGEPVVPWYPATRNNAFIAIPSFRPALNAEVRDIKMDPDELAKALFKEYPGLPLNLHENYVFAIAVAAGKFSVGTRFRVLVDDDTAKLQQVGTDALYTLWNKQPL